MRNYQLKKMNVLIKTNLVIITKKNYCVKSNFIKLYFVVCNYFEQTLQYCYYYH